MHHLFRAETQNTPRKPFDNDKLYLCALGVFAYTDVGKERKLCESYKFL